MSQLVKFVKKFVRNEEEGATMVEYGIVVALIAVVAIGAVTGVGTALIAQFGAIATAVTPA